jgi:hypothetical protein
MYSGLAWNVSCFIIANEHLVLNEKYDIVMGKKNPLQITSIALPVVNQ